jgi:hypothetical protein
MTPRLIPLPPTHNPSTSHNLNTTSPNNDLSEQTPACNCQFGGIYLLHARRYPGRCRWAVTTSLILRCFCTVMDLVFASRRADRPRTTRLANRSIRKREHQSNVRTPGAPKAFFALHLTFRVLSGTPNLVMFLSHSPSRFKICTPLAIRARTIPEPLRLWLATC